MKPAVRGAWARTGLGGWQSLQRREGITPNSYLLGGCGWAVQRAAVSVEEKPAAAALPRVLGSWLQGCHGLAASVQVAHGLYQWHRKEAPSGSAQSHEGRARARWGACVPAARGPGIPQWQGVQLSPGALVLPGAGVPQGQTSWRCWSLRAHLAPAKDRTPDAEGSDHSPLWAELCSPQSHLLGS